MSWSRLFAIGVATMAAVTGMAKPSQAIAPAPPAEPSKKTGDAVATEFLKAFNASRLDELSNLFTDDAVVVDGSRDLAGRPNVRTYFEHVLRVRVQRVHETVYAFPGGAVIEWLQCYERTGNGFFSLRGADVLRLNSTGLIKHHQTYADDILFAKKLSDPPLNASPCASAPATKTVNAVEVPADPSIAGVWPHVPSPQIGPNLEDFALRDDPNTAPTGAQHVYQHVFGKAVMGRSSVWTADGKVLVQYTMHIPAGVRALTSPKVPAMKEHATIHALDIVTVAKRQRRTYWNRNGAR